MALTPLAKTLLPGAFTVTGAALAAQASDNVNGNSIVLTGNEIVIAFNSDVSAHTVTINSVGDQEGRTSDITALNIAAGAYQVFQRFPLNGWLQSDGTLHLSTNSALIKFFVIQIQ